MWRSSVPQQPPSTFRPYTSRRATISSASCPGDSASRWSRPSNSSGGRREAFALKSSSAHPGQPPQTLVASQGLPEHRGMDAVDGVVCGPGRNRAVDPLDDRRQRRAVQERSAAPDHDAYGIGQPRPGHRLCHAERLRGGRDGRGYEQVHTGLGERLGLRPMIVGGHVRPRGLLGLVAVALRADHPGDVHLLPVVAEPLPEAGQESEAVGVDPMDIARRRGTPPVAAARVRPGTSAPRSASARHGGGPRRDSVGRGSPAPHDPGHRPRAVWVRSRGRGERTTGAPGRCQWPRRSGGSRIVPGRRGSPSGFGSRWGPPRSRRSITSEDASGESEGGDLGRPVRSDRWAIPPSRCSGPTAS